MKTFIAKSTEIPVECVDLSTNHTKITFVHVSTCTTQVDFTACCQVHYVIWGVLLIANLENRIVRFRNLVTRAFPKEYKWQTVASRKDD